jgi:hypothetical protein
VELGEERKEDGELRVDVVLVVRHGGGVLNKGTQHQAMSLSLDRTTSPSRVDEGRTGKEERKGKRTARSPTMAMASPKSGPGVATRALRRRLMRTSGLRREGLNWYLRDGWKSKQGREESERENKRKATVGHLSVCDRPKGDGPLGELGTGAGRIKGEEVERTNSLRVARLARAS